MSAQGTESARGACGVHSLLALIPVDACVLRLPADGDDVRAAVAVELGDREVFDRDAALVEELARPLRAEGLGRAVDADAAALSAALLAAADDQLVGAVAVEVGGRDGVAPLELVVDDVAVPHRALLLRLGVDDDLEAVPRLDGGDELLAA